MHEKKLILIVVIGALFVGNVYFGLKARNSSIELAISKADAASIHKNDQVINFTRLFVDKVLNADKEVDFETRLQLENLVRDLKDDQILSGWQRFTESKTDNEAVKNVKDFLTILIKKAN